MVGFRFVSILGHRCWWDSTICGAVHHVEPPASRGRLHRVQHVPSALWWRLGAGVRAAGMAACAATLTGRTPAVQRPVRHEQLISPLVPTPLQGWPPPAPAPLPMLPTRGLPTGIGPQGLLVETVHLDHSGRLSARGSLRASGWTAGHRVDIAVTDGAVVIGSAAAGLHAVSARGELALPATARRMCGITPDPPMLLAAWLPHDILVVHPAHAVGQHHGHVPAMAQPRGQGRWPLPGRPRTDRGRLDRAGSVRLDRRDGSATLRRSRPRIPAPACRSHWSDQGQHAALPDRVPPRRVAECGHGGGGDVARSRHHPGTTRVRLTSGAVSTIPADDEPQATVPREEGWHSGT
jgi:hypothetical protein